MTDLASLVGAARVHVEAGQLSHAEIHYRLVRDTTTPPKTGRERVAHGEACAFFAKKALAKGWVGEAGDWLREAIDADPEAADYRIDMAMRVLLPIGMLDAARVEVQRATQIEPDNVRAWRALGGVEHERGDAAASRAARGRALELAPDDPVVRLDAATLEIDTANYARARELLSAVLAEHPDRVGDALHCLAMIAYREGRHETAVDLYSEAIEKGCRDRAMARWNRALPLHSLGRYREGWADYEARGEQMTSPLFRTAMRRFSLPLWRGEAEHPAPARLHLHEEMGYGDTIALARFAPFLAARGYDVRLEVRESLLELFRRSFPAVKIVPKAIDYPRALRIAAFDYHAPLLSLPHALDLELDTIPWSGPYLAPDPRLAEDYREHLPSGFKIGVCWSSGIRDGIWLREYGLRKSMRPRDLVPLFRDAAAHFISLQTGPEGSAELSSWFVKALPSDPSWDDTAALVACLDLVITVDTAVAHLAGAMGKPTWLMMHSEGSWHWMVERTDSPWYPTVRIFRQQRPHDWAPVIRRLAAELRPLVQAAA
jgi:tetratricopeptide (TPR) repeat protein